MVFWEDSLPCLLLRNNSNIYNQVFGPGPDKSLQPSPGDAKKFQDLTLSGTALADTLSILDERVQLTLGARYQRIDSTFFNITTGAVTSNYNEGKITPMVGLVVKPWQRLALYANYIQGLQEGPVAPLTAANAGEGFDPFVTKQYEVGAKLDFGRFATTLALTRPTPRAFLAGRAWTLASVTNSTRR
jgi:iron complex outermembrane receptor protein